MKESTRFIPTNKLEQYDVVNKKGQDMGQVQNFVVDMVAGRIAFVVVAFGGMLGISDKWFAMPWDILTWSVENKKFILDMSNETLKEAPGMDKNKWPNEINFDLVAKSYSHFGVAPYWDSSYPKGVTSSPIGLLVATLSSIEVTPVSLAKLAVGSTRQFTAIGTYSDRSTANITSKVTWVSSAAKIATISSVGLATGLAVGNTNITAALSGVISPTVNLGVIARTT